MDPLMEKRLEESVTQMAQLMLAEGDQDYILGLSPPALMEALETELRFMGFYSHDDHETPQIIHAILERNLPHWSYMRKMNHLT